MARQKPWQCPHCRKTFQPTSTPRLTFLAQCHHITTCQAKNPKRG